MASKIYSVCWNITSRCNDNCKFCFRDQESRELSYEKNLLLLTKLIDHGVKKITFSGGEATLYKDLFKLIGEAKKYGIITNLATNAKELSSDILLDITNNLNWISLPLDAPTINIQRKMTRNYNHFNNIIRLLSWHRSSKSNIKIKINTLVTSINYLYIQDMIPIINKYKVDRWKLLQFFPARGDAIINTDKYMISKGKYESFKKNIMRHPKRNSNISISFEDSLKLKRSYFVIAPNGNIFSYNTIHQEEYFAGNLQYDSISTILSRIDFDYKLNKLRFERYLNPLLEGNETLL